jgi:hypothetical protein
MFGTATVLARNNYFGTRQATTLEWIVIAWWITSSVILLLHHKHRTLHDFIADTVYQLSETYSLHLF